MGFRQGLDGVQIGFRCCYCCNQNVVVVVAAVDVVAAVVFVAAVVVVDAVMVAVMVAVLVFVCVLCLPFFYCIDALQCIMRRRGTSDHETVDAKTGDAGTERHQKLRNFDTLRW